VRLSGFHKLHAPFLNERRTRGLVPLPRAGNSGHLARTPDFLPCRACCGHGGGFLLRKGAGSLLEQSSSTGNPGFCEMWDTTDSSVKARRAARQTSAQPGRAGVAITMIPPAPACRGSAVGAAPLPRCKGASRVTNLRHTHYGRLNFLPHGTTVPALS
jgi:hypothetical protein